MKIWTIKGRDELYADEELILMIKHGLIDGDALLATKDMKHHVRLKDSIYQFYLKEDTKDETL